MHCERDTEVVTLTGVMGWDQGTIGVRIYRDQAKSTEYNSSEYFIYILLSILSIRIECSLKQSFGGVRDTERVREVYSTIFFTF